MRATRRCAIIMGLKYVPKVVKRAMHSWQQGSAIALMHAAEMRKDPWRRHLATMHIQSAKFYRKEGDCDNYTQ